MRGFDISSHLPILLQREPGTNFFLCRSLDTAEASCGNQQSPSLQAAVLRIPPWLALYLSEPLGMVMSMRQRLCEAGQRCEGAHEDGEVCGGKTNDLQYVIE
jgi:hypothetical protein